MYLKVREISQRFGVSKDTVYAWARTGRIPGVVRIAGTVRIDLEKFDEFIQRGGTGGRRHMPANEKPAR